MAPKKKTFSLTINYGIVVFATTALGFIGGMTINAYSIASNIATKPYVDKGLDENRKYTDMRATDTLKDAIAHSDANRQAMTIDMREYGSDLKAVSVKTDLVLTAVTKLQDDQARRRR